MPFPNLTHRVVTIPLAGGTIASMTSARVEHFAEAKAHEHELNERQRRVLDLLVEGKTNGEVAGALGITLDGAKWNVSEILGKLGLATREEAADYWRWRNRHGRGALRALRGLAVPAALKWAAGGVAAMAVAAIAVGLYAARDDGAAAPGEFYLEARIEVVDRSRTVGTSIAGAEAENRRLREALEEIRRMTVALGYDGGHLGVATVAANALTPAADDAETTVSTLRWWSKDRDHARWEIHRQEDGAGPPEVITVVMDGTWQWVYSSDTNTYSKSALPPLPDGVETRPLALSLLIGPAGVASKAQLIDQLLGWTGEGGYAREAGPAVVLGRETTVVEFGPTSRSSSSGATATGSQTPNTSAPQPSETTSGAARLWLDEERMVVMRYVVAADVQDIHAEVLRLDWGAPVPAPQLVFTPPPGATLVDEQTGAPGGDSEGGEVSAGGTLEYSPPAGFFAIAYLPDGFAAREYEQKSDANKKPTRLTVKFVGAGPGTDLNVDQSRSSGPLQLRDEPMEYLLVGGAETFLAERAGDPGLGPEIALTTRRDGVNITITAHGLSREEVIAVAEGLELVR